MNIYVSFKSAITIGWKFVDQIMQNPNGKTDERVSGVDGLCGRLLGYADKIAIDRSGSIPPTGSRFLFKTLTAGFGRF